MTPFLGQDACIAIEDAMVLGRAFAAASTFAQAFSIYEDTRKERANGVQLASRRQADEIQGVTPRGANPGASAMERGLYSYNPLRCRWRGRARRTAEARQPAMSALGQKRTFRNVWSMSASPPKADIRWCGCDVRFVPMADIRRAFSRDGFPSIPTVPHRSSSTRRPPKEQCR